MPRPNRPRWFEPRRCWRTAINGKLHYFGKEIPREERPQIDKVPVRAWEAMAALVAREAAKPVDPSDLTCYALAQLYLADAERQAEAGRMTPANYRVHRTHLGRWVEFVGSERRVKTLTTADLEAFVNACQEAACTPHYVANLCKSVQAALNWAARPVAGREPVRLLEINPLRGYRPPIPRQAERYLDQALAKRFLRWAWARARARAGLQRRFDRLTVTLLQAIRLTGARPGELCDLRWDDIHWREHVAVLPPQRHKTGWKTGKIREIHLTRPLLTLLRGIRRLPAHHPEFVWTHRLGRGGASVRGGLSLCGEPWDSIALAAKVRRWRAELVADVKERIKRGEPTHGLERIQASGPGRFVAYILRHSYATDAIQSGLTHAQVAELIGNTAAVTEETYAHIQRKAAAKWAREVGRSRKEE